MRSTLTKLSDDWRLLADQQRQFGAETHARILEYCAHQLTSALRSSEDELLDLRQAATESGYSADHLGRLLREGRLPNAGRKARPLIRRKELPRKPSRSATESAPQRESRYDVHRLFRDIATSKLGER